MKLRASQSIFLKIFLLTFGISAGPFLLIGLYQLIRFHKVVYGVNNPLVIVVSLSILFSITAAGLIARDITTPIRILLDSIKDYRVKQIRPDFSNVARSDEFSYLFEEYTKMIDEIIAYQNELTKTAHLTAIGSTVAVVAHELRTPLGAIITNAFGIKKYLPVLIKAFQEAQKMSPDKYNIREDHLRILSQALKNIEEEAQSLFTVVNMLLVNATQEKIQSADFKPCSISACLEKALMRYPFHSKQSSQIKWDKKNHFTFHGNELLIIHVLFNLIKNALYYIEAAGGGDIIIQLQCGSQKESYNLLRFKDTGKGIPADILPKIFDRFYSRTYHGVGIGLAYCKMVMEALGGSIDCASELGSYTEFILKFPKV